ncbi:hypothetical protein FRC09_000708 [Ceratobasidium sp. 395]|nr:hypothetical protein FRC09_000708 [Ceratobasidium sp. 395]
MARQKQALRKSTGGKAPRGSMPVCNLSEDEAKASDLPQRDQGPPRCGPPAERGEGPEASESSRRPTGKRKKSYRVGYRGFRGGIDQDPDGYSNTRRRRFDEPKLLRHERAENERETAVFEANTAHSTAIVHQQQKTYTAEPATHEKVITDLRLQLKAAQSQSEIAEPQRQAALEQYMIASNEAKSLSGVNRALNQRVGTLEKQLTTGLTQWRHGHETNPRRNEQKLKRL